MDFKFKERQSLSHEVSEFGSYLFGSRVGFSSVHESVDALESEIDLIIETEEDQARMGSTNIASEKFTEEVFARCYENAPKEKSNGWSAVQEMLTELPEVQQLLQTCQGDADLSALAAANIASTFSEQIAQGLKEYQDHQEEQQDDQQNQEGDSGSPSQEGQDGQGQGNQQEGQPEFKPSKELQESVSAQAVKLEEVLDKLKEMKKSLDGCGSLATAGKASDLDRMTLVNELSTNDRLKYIFKMIGRLKQCMRGLPSYEFNEEQREQIVTVGRGSYTDLLPTEQQLLADDVGTDIFMDRWIRRCQLKWRKRGKTKTAAGPIVVLVDESGSMSCNRRNEMACSFAAAVASLANEDNRSFWCVGFNGNITHRTSIIKKKGSVNQNPVTGLQAIRYIANRGSGGGTSYTRPIEEALYLVSQVKKADIILLTDGSCSVSSDLIEKVEKGRKDYGLRLFTILIGGVQANVDGISDAVIGVENLDDETSLQNLAKIMKGSRR